MPELRLKQIFENFFDCYADTHADVGGCVVDEEEVIPAMTSERFVEVVTGIFANIAYYNTK